jgi:23S rRNA U2552 (ribose-2'-O)-methylase RlmE/FtsJ
MMRQIGDELHSNTWAFLLPSAVGEPANILDLCMAPGGFTASVLQSKPDARVCGITLPLSQSGHEILLPNWQTNSSIRVCFLDITMLAAEMDVTNIPRAHPDASNFLLDRPFSDERFDLTFCDGQVLRMHPRAEYRESREAKRLLTSQLVLALQRTKVNGKIVLLLHKIDAWDTVVLLHTLSKFSSLRSFKPVKKHAIRSSFYVVAEQVQPKSEDALQAVASWKREWHMATFGSDAEYLENRNTFNGHAQDVLLEFGTELIRLGGPIWRIQCAALRRSSFLS